MMVYTTDMAKGYEINEKDIDTVLGILKRNDPENATPEMAIAVLEELQKRVHELSHTDPELLIEIYNDLQTAKNKKIN